MNVETQLTYRYLAKKLRRIDIDEVIRLSEHIGLLEMRVDGEALLIRRELYGNDPWLVVKDGEISLWRSREDYEIGNLVESEVIEE